MAKCINDTCIRPVRPAYMNLHKWQESGSEFGRPDSYKGRRLPAPRVVDFRSCRQLYLRSYTFSRKESMHEKTKKCFGKVREKIKNRRSRKRSSSNSKASNNNKSFDKKGSSRRVSCAALFSIFRRLLSCTTKVDVAEHTRP